MGISTLRQYHPANDELSRAKRAADAAKAKHELAASALAVAESELSAALAHLASLEAPESAPADPPSDKEPGTEAAPKKKRG